MAKLSLKLNFECNLYAASPKDNKAIKSGDERKLASLILKYWPNGDKNFAYDIYIDPEDFKKETDVGAEISDSSKVWAKGVANIFKPKAEMLEDLSDDKNPIFVLSHVMFSPFLELYPNKDKSPLSISCEVN